MGKVVSSKYQYSFERKTVPSPKKRFSDSDRQINFVLPKGGEILTSRIEIETKSLTNAIF